MGNSESSLLSAARSGDVDTIERLLKDKVNVNTQDEVCAVREYIYIIKNGFTIQINLIYYSMKKNPYSNLCLFLFNK